MVTTSPKLRSEKSDKRKVHPVQPGKSDSPIVDRVREALGRLEGEHDMAWLARQAGIPASTFYDNLKNGITKTDLAMKVAHTLNVSLDWLLEGSEPQLAEALRRRSTRHRTAQPVSEQDAADQLGLTLIPEVDISYSLGGGSVHQDYVEAQMVPFRSDWLERIGRGRPADFFLAAGVGDSMMPTILDGDDILVNRAEQVIRHQDRIWAVGYGELGMIKRVRRLPSGMFQLNSDNPAVTPIEATEDELFVVGRVAWIGRRV